MGASISNSNPRSIISSQSIFGSIRSSIRSSSIIIPLSITIPNLRRHNTPIHPHIISMIIKGMNMIPDTNHHGEISREEEVGIPREEEVVAEIVAAIAMATGVQGGIILVLPPSILPAPTPWVVLAVRHGARRRTPQATLVTSNLIITIITFQFSPIAVIITRTMRVLLLRTMVLPVGMVVLQMAAGETPTTHLIREAMIRHYPRNHSEAWKTSKSRCKVLCTVQASRGNGDWMFPLEVAIIHRRGHNRLHQGLTDEWTPFHCNCTSSNGS